MKLIPLIFLIISITTSAQTHRIFGVNDTTSYKVNDNTIFVSAGILSLNDNIVFDINSLGLSDNYFLADFDAINEDIWYLLVASRYSSEISYLMRTTDKGQSWRQDTSFYNATAQVSTTDYNNKLINQVYIGPQNEILLFIGYYESGIVYSTDSGSSWNLWFNNLQTYYSGILECGSDFFLYSFEGDAISANAFKINYEDFLEHEPDEWFPGGQYHPNCIGQVNPECIYAPNNLNGFQQFLVFKNYIGDNCELSSILDNEDSNNDFIIKCYFSEGDIHLEFNSAIEGLVKLYNLNGSNVFKGKIPDKQVISFKTDLPKGIYFVEIVSHLTVQRKKILKSE